MVSTIMSGPANKGVFVAELGMGESLTLRTVNRSYSLIYLGGRRGLLSGHPQFCKEPTPVRIEGSTWGGTVIEPGFLGEGMHLECVLPSGQRMTTSPVIEIQRLDMLSNAS